MMGQTLRWWAGGVALVWLLCCPQDGAALEPGEVLVIVNRHSVHGARLAEYYMEKRGIPPGNLVQLAVPDKEECSREIYDTRIALPVRRWLAEKDPLNRIRCLVTVFGMPLKIEPPVIGDKEKKTADRLRHRHKSLSEKLKGLGEKSPEQAQQLKKEIASVDKRLKAVTRRHERSALDSELALVTAGAYDLSGWVPNPYFMGFRKKTLSIVRKDVKWVSRLDGPTPSTVRRIVDDSLRVEKQGLKGQAYFDARWVAPDTEKLRGYALYDASIHRAADRIRNSGRMPVVVDDKATLFGADEAPGAALYCGWYSLGKYVDAFQWKQGAVGYHIASTECRTLKKPGSQVWCKRMLEEGVAATVGPTSEPYVQAFPMPEVFFGLLVDGRLTLAECYAAALPFWSWQMVLIGDPLYRPFKSGKMGSPLKPSGGYGPLRRD